MKLLQKTVLVATTALVAISTAEANKKNFRSGVYAGAELGWLYDEHKYTEVRNIIGVPLNPPILGGSLNPLTQSSKKNSDSFLPGIFVGYRQFLSPRMDCYFIGFELSAYLNSSKSTSHSFSDTFSLGVTKHKLKGKYNIIPALTFGRTWNDRVGLYGKVGYDFAEYNYSLRETSGGVVTNKKHSHKDVNRFLLGAGVEYAINCLWAARLEYNYSFAQSRKIKMHSADAANGINDYVGKVKVSSSALKVGMFAKF